jgi:SAM-dependent methyltransferase
MHVCADTLAAMEFRIAWQSREARHTEVRHAPAVNLWRDLLPAPLYAAIVGKRPGEGIELSFAPGEIVRQRQEERIMHLPTGASDPAFGPQHIIEPRRGRFYPLGMLNRVLPGVFRENLTPFRCIGHNGGLVADLNHPLAGHRLEVAVAVHDVMPKSDERGGSCSDWIELAVDGPGMQARHDGLPTDFFTDSPFRRRDDSDDARFYAQPRMVQHLDRTAIAGLTALYRRHLPADARVLDLMSSWTSHLPADLMLEEVTGLGMNAAELDANARLDRRVVHDLNRDPRLPFADGTFDAAVCSLSVEYLTRPFAVFAEVARVLKSGAVFLVTFSDRWFPPKAIALWSELHPFERLGLVLEYFLETGRFDQLETYSLQGLPRPSDDRYFPERQRSDPLFAVWGRRRAQTAG